MNIKNRTYSFYNDLINIKDFNARLLKLDKKTSMGLGIYYIGYATKKPEWNSVNSFYLIINRIDGFIEKKDDNKYLKIDISKGIDFDKTNKSAECMICHYWYFKCIVFKYQPDVCNGCYDFSMIVQNLNGFVILKIKGFDYKCYIVGMNKKDAISFVK